MERITETPVSFDSSGVRLNGILHVPAQLSWFPAVLICHGYFQSNRIGPLGLYVQLARAMAMTGIACFRFDLSGFGESHGKYADVSYETLTSDLTNALAMLLRVPGVDSSRVGILGHSLGGNIAIEVASFSPLVSVLCLLSPNPTQDESDIEIFSTVQLTELKSTGHTLRKRILASQLVYGPVNEGVTIQKAPLVRAETMLVYGTDDPYYTSSHYSRLTQAFRAPIITTRIPHADHNFLPAHCRDELIAKILKWMSAKFADSSRG